MAVSFLVGRAGSGKTFKIIDEVTQAIISAADDLSAPPIIVLVPDQAALNTDLQIMKTLVEKGRNATSRLYVCSFNRLINLILENSEIVKRPKLSEFGYLLICQQAMRDIYDKLQFYKSLSPKLVAELVNSIIELSQYRVSAENLKNAAEGLQSREFHDLALIYNRFLELVSSQYREQLSDTNAVLDLLRTSAKFQNALVWVDGFASLNQLQEELLVGLCSVASQLKIAILLDPDNIPEVETPEDIDPTRLFATTEKMLFKLLKRLPNSHIEPLTVVHRYQSETLKCLETLLMSPTKRLISNDDINVWICSNQREEIRAVIRDIIRLNTELQIPFNRIAIAISNFEAYKNQLSYELQRYKIPYLIDFTTELGHHPYCQLVSILLRLSINDFQWYDVIDLIRTDLIDLPHEDGWILEDFISNHHISGSNIWLSNNPWKFGLDDVSENEEYFVTKQRNRLTQVDEIRKKLVPLLTQINTLSMTPVWNAIGLCTALREIIDSTNTLKIIEQWSKDPQIAAVHKTAVDKVQQLFIELESIVNPNDFRPIADWQIQIEQALKLIQQRVPPMKTNSIIIGTIEQSRMPELHTLYLMGMDDSGFPRTHIDSPIINSVMRERLRESGIHVGPTITERQYNENFLSYVALTRASNRIILTMSSQNKKGEEQRQSALIQFLNLVSNKTIKNSYLPNKANLQTPSHLIELTESVIDAMKSKKIDNFNNYLSIRDQYEYVFTNIINSLDPVVGGKVSTDDLHSILLKKKQKTIFETSITALENYAKCPYKYYLNNVIRLSAKQDDPFNHMKLGDLIHHALARMSVNLNNENRSWNDADLSLELKKAFNTEMEIFSILFTGSEVLNWQIEVLQQTGDVILQQFSKYLQKWATLPELKPILFEWPFSNAKPIDIDNGISVALRGKIDRIDQITNSKNYLIVDYKLRPKKLDYSQLFYGYSLQLPAYILAFSSAQDNQTKNVTACVFQTIIPNSSQKPIETEEETINLWQLRGVINYTYWQNIFSEGLTPFYNIKLNKDGSPSAYSDSVLNNEFEIFKNWALKKIIDHAQNILKSLFYPDPKQNGKNLECEYCTHKQACRFDRLLAHPKKNPSIRKKDFYIMASRLLS